MNDRVQTGGDFTVDGAVNYGNLDSAITYATANDSYLGFSVTINNLTTANLPSIDFVYTSTSGFDFDFGVSSDKTGFTVGDELAGVFDDDGGSPSLSGPFNLSGNTRIHNLDSVSLEGNVSVIPEPSATLLGGLGLLALLCRRR